MEDPSTFCINLEVEEDISAGLTALTMTKHSHICEPPQVPLVLLQMESTQSPRVSGIAALNVIDCGMLGRSISVSMMCEAPRNP